MKAEPTVRTDVIRFNAGTCPACREYLWADVTVQTKTYPPSLDGQGKASAQTFAETTAVALTHECDREGDR